MSRAARLDKKYLWHPFTQQAEWEEGRPLVVARARGARFWDERGRSFVDGVSSLWVTAHGHRHPALDRAVRRQLSKVAHTTFLGLTHLPAAELGKALVDLAPKGLRRVFYSDNGATAVEVALKMAFQYWVQRGQPRRTEFLALQGSYHGDTLGAVSVGGIAAFQKKFKPLLFKSHFLPAPHCFTCPFRRAAARPEIRTGDDRPPAPGRAGSFRPETGCRWQCLAAAERIVQKKAPRLAAAIVEPLVQGAAGMRVMPAGYLSGLARILKKHGVLLIADEVATGFGRTGRMFAVEHEKVTPDFLCVAKALTGGYLPLAATLTRESVYRAFLGRYEEFKTFFHGHSYTANPVACAVARENLNVYTREKTLAVLKAKRRRLSEFLRAMAAHPRVGHVRQMGFMAGIELVADKKAGRPFPVAFRAGARVCRAALARGVWLRPLGDVIVVLPPLGIARGDLEKLLSAIRAGLEELRGP